MPTPVHCFYGIKSPLSNFHPARFVIDGLEYSCVEQYMQAEKARMFGDTERDEQMMKATTPLAMKRLGRQVTPFDKDVWASRSRDVVETGLRAKFTQNPELRAALLLTGEAVIVECAPRDRLWGAGLGRARVEQIAEETPAGARLALRGRNMLGALLMRVRADLK